MVVYMLYMKAELENIASLNIVQDGTASFCFSVRNPYDPTQIRDHVVVDTSILHQPSLTNAQGQQQKHRKEQKPFHFSMKWGAGIGERATMRILGIEGSQYQQDDVPNPHRVTPNHEYLEEKIHQRNNNNKNKIKEKLTPDCINAMNNCRSIITSNDSGHWVPMVAIECHGMEPFAYHPGNTEFWAVSSSSSSNGQQQQGKIYASPQLDLTDGGDWSDYDLSMGSVSITNLVGEFR